MVQLELKVSVNMSMKYRLHQFAPSEFLKKSWSIEKVQQFVQSEKELSELINIQLKVKCDSIIFLQLSVMLIFFMTYGNLSAYPSFPTWKVYHQIQMNACLSTKTEVCNDFHFVKKAASSVARL